MEIGYLSEKLRIDISIASVIKLTEENKNFIIYSLDSENIVEAFKIKTIPELHDRLIAAASVVLSAVLITNDPLIRQWLDVNTIW